MMNVTLNKFLAIGLVAVLLPMAGEALAQCIDAIDCDDKESIPDPLPNCNPGLPLAGDVTIICPFDPTKARIVQVYNPNTPKGTSVKNACVCNAKFVRCNPNVPAGTKVPEGQPPACEPGNVRMVPPEAQLIGSNTTYCVTSGGKKTCYNRR